jgi:hypothetical protein
VRERRALPLPQLVEGRRGGELPLRQGPEHGVRQVAQLERLSKRAPSVGWLASRLAGQPASHCIVEHAGPDAPREEVLVAAQVLVVGLGLVASAQCVDEVERQVLAVEAKRSEVIGCFHQNEVYRDQDPVTTKVRITGNTRRSRCSMR